MLDFGSWIIKSLLCFISKAVSYYPSNFSTKCCSLGERKSKIIGLCIKHDRFQRMTKILSNEEIEAERYEVMTSDGFKIVLHRLCLKAINETIKNSESSIFKEPLTSNIQINGLYVSSKNRVVFFQHGLLESSLNWIIAGERSLPFAFLRLGYDVWLGNNRGNEYVTFTKKLFPSDYLNAENTVFKCMPDDDNLIDSSFINEKQVPYKPENISYLWRYIKKCEVLLRKNLSNKILKSNFMTKVLCVICNTTQKFNYNHASKNWSFEDMALYDIPAMLSLVLKFTGGKKILCFGQSQGAAQLLVALSLNPQLSENIHGLQLFSPPIVLRTPDSYTFLVKVLMWLSRNCLYFTLQVVHFLKYILPSFVLSHIANIVVEKGMKFYLTDVNDADRRIIFRYTPSGGMSQKNFDHWYQIITKNRVLSSYGDSCGNSFPYPLHKILSPMHIYFGQKDNLVDVDESVKHIKMSLTDNQCKIDVFDNWSHVDFEWGSGRFQDFNDNVIASSENMCCR